ncbi:hypothetical protein [uncultured Paraglaciecola sp.]|uniref:hypothetical protein n=1 Tax=uncultured Paraglaciecola sp. TaxID=1765024 RepID=UPI00260DA547|nr:hypothetical protein [uncultured Paraglaciecola sp.]
MNNFVGKERAKLVLNVHKELTTTTPRDTSWAANNWVSQIGTPSRVTVGSRDNVGGAASASQFSLAQVVGTLNVQTDNSNQDIFISNNVPYIRPLNDGHSKQAPSGFVQIAVAAGLAKST